MATDTDAISSLSRRLQQLPRFLRFAIVGAAGFFVDVAILLVCMRMFDTGPYLGRMISYMCAATCTWYMNRSFTFADNQGSHRGKEWFLFVLCSSLAGLLNYGAFAIFVYLVGQNVWSPTVGVGLGACAGLLVNYTLSKRLVFRNLADVEPQ